MRPTVFVIFGVTGDLTERKLLSALYNLARAKKLPRDFYIAGFARRAWDGDVLRRRFEEAIKKYVPKCEAKILRMLLHKVFYVRGNFEEQGDYLKLKEFLDGLEKRTGSHMDKVFYLAVAPSYYPVIFEELGKCGLAQCCRGNQSKLLIEKPFGKDLRSAVRLNKILQRHFEESQIYRIDHYLAKEPVQNILAFRFANGIFEHLWNKKYIKEIRITVAEKIGIESRGGYYEQSGVLLDMVQNHILQLLALTCMEEPLSLAAESIRDKKAELLKYVRVSLDKKDVKKAQYLGYRKEEKVSPKSATETYAALKFSIGNRRWRGVPVFVQSGKALGEKLTEISVEFMMPRAQFLGDARHELSPNVLRLRIQPNEAILLDFQVKTPKFETELHLAEMRFNYSSHFGGAAPEAYERIIFDALAGNQLLFVRADSAIRQWQIISRLQKSWHKYPLGFYKPGKLGVELQ